MQSSMQQSKSDRKAMLPWEAKEIANLEYRIRFRRFSDQSEGPPDTAFYFQNQEDVRTKLFKQIRLIF